MPSSDSEGFESADEGHSKVDKKERKKRNSSSNYSDNALESDGSAYKTSIPITTKGKTQKQSEETDGWDDFDVEEEVMKQPSLEKEKSDENKPKAKEDSKKTKDVRESQDTGWDDFDDWGDDNVNDIKEQQQKSHMEQQLNVKEVTERLAAATTGSQSSNTEGSGGWGWGWGVDSLLSSATAGISTITNQVSQGITTVLETGIGAPDPEELARKKAKDDNSSEKEEKSKKLEDKLEGPDAAKDSGDGAFPFGSILKFVGDTGSKVITGGLDTLETIGRKTMEVLQDGDPRLVKKRAMLGLNTEDKPVLSQVLREAKAKAEEEDRIREEKREAKEVHYENLFDDFEGLVHLEALEMLSKQLSMRIDEQMRQATPEKRQEMKETFQQIAELCEMPEEEEEIEEDGEELSKPDAFHERLQRATQDLGVKLQFQPLVKQHTEILEWLSSQDLTMKSVNKKAISSLAQTTALSVEVYHKAAEMLLVKTRRSTADEADAMTQMTAVLTKHTSEMATLFTEKLNSISKAEDSEQCNTFITNIFLEAGNSSTYIQNAFQLAQPIIQIGAV